MRYGRGGGGTELAMIGREKPRETREAQDCLVQKVWSFSTHFFTVSNLLVTVYTCPVCVNIIHNLFEYSNPVCRLRVPAVPC